MRLGSEAGQINDQIISKLSSLPDANTSVTIEIEIIVPSGIPNEKISKIEEDCKTMKIENYGFEEE